MADEEQQLELMRSGTDWEVVSLTSSTYDAAPNKGGIISGASKDKSHQGSSLFESGHFVFPPSEHENLPIDAEKEGEGQKEQDRLDEELKTVPQSQSFEKERFQETSSDTEKHEDELHSEPEKKEEGRKDGLEWVKKRGLWLYRHVKEANTVWSVMVAAALVGIVILGQRWQREKSQHQYQLK